MAQGTCSSCYAPSTSCFIYPMHACSRSEQRRLCNSQLLSIYPASAGVRCHRIRTIVPYHHTIPSCYRTTLQLHNAKCSRHRTRLHIRTHPPDFIIRSHSSSLLIYPHLEHRILRHICIFISDSRYLRHDCPHCYLQCCTAMNCCFRHTLNTYLHRHRLRDRSRSVISHFTSCTGARNYVLTPALRLRARCMHVLSSWALFPRIALRAACAWAVV